MTKKYLKLGAEQAGAEWVAWLFAASSLLNAACFLPILWRAWIKAPPAKWPHGQSFGKEETHWMLILPPLVTALLVGWAGLFADSTYSPLAWVKLIAAREFGP